MAFRIFRSNFPVSRPIWPLPRRAGQSPGISSHSEPQQHANHLHLAERLFDPLAANGAGPVPSFFAVFSAIANFRPLLVFSATWGSTPSRIAVTKAASSQPLSPPSVIPSGSPKFLVIISATSRSAVLVASVILAPTVRPWGFSSSDARIWYGFPLWLGAFLYSRASSSLIQACVWLLSFSSRNSCVTLRLGVGGLPLPSLDRKLSRADRAERPQQQFA